MNLKTVRNIFKVLFVLMFIGVVAGNITKNDLFFYITIVSGILFFIIGKIFYVCPHCKKSLNIKDHGKCPQCGKDLGI